MSKLTIAICISLLVVLIGMLATCGQSKVKKVITPSYTLITNEDRNGILYPQIEMAMTSQPDKLKSNDFSGNSWQLKSNSFYKSHLN
jgi:hypothetical protein